MLSSIKPIVEKQAVHVVKFLGPLNPNVLTAIGSIPPLLFFVFVIMKMYWLAVLMIPLSAIDTLDGTLARLQNKVTKFGGFLDSTLDRISDFLYICPFGFAHIARWEIVAPLFLVSFLISYTRSRAELASGGKISMAVGLIERTERMIFLFASLVIYIFTQSVKIAGFSTIEILFGILLILSIITFFQRVMFAYKHL